MKKLIICVLILMFAVPAFARMDCEKALQKYGDKLKGWSCNDRWSEDELNNQLVAQFKRYAAEKRRNNPAPAQTRQPNSPSAETSQAVNTKAKVEEKPLPNFQMKELKVTW